MHTLVVFLHSCFDFLVLIWVVVVIRLVSVSQEGWVLALVKRFTGKVVSEMTYNYVKPCLTQFSKWWFGHCILRILIINNAE